MASASEKARDEIVADGSVNPSVVTCLYIPIGRGDRFKIYLFWVRIPIEVLRYVCLRQTLVAITISKQKTTISRKLEYR